MCASTCTLHQPSKPLILVSLGSKQIVGTYIDRYLYVLILCCRTYQSGTLSYQRVKWRSCQRWTAGKPGVSATSPSSSASRSTPSSPSRNSAFVHLHSLYSELPVLGGQPQTKGLLKIESFYV